MKPCLTDKWLEREREIIGDAESEGGRERGLEREKQVQRKKAEREREEVTRRSSVEESHRFV